jgi:superfamily I DNA/RNA helicase
MTIDKDLIGKIRKLRQIKPAKDWVFTTKAQILDLDRERVSVGFFPYFKPALAGFFVVLMFLGLVGFAKDSLPGDPLYVIRKIVHLGQAILTPEAEKPAFQLKLANERLEDLAKAPAKNLSATINEFQANVSQAAKEMSKMDATTSAPSLIKKIVEGTKKLKENKQKAESLGVVIDGTEELDNALGKIAGNLIGDLEKRSLTAERQDILAKMKELFEQGKYSEALELYLLNQ